MEFTDGTYSRDFTGRKNLSFLLRDSSVNNSSGESSFGISGESQSLEFKFKGGKIFDFDDVFVSSYDTSSAFEISGDVSEGYYDYSINGESIARGVAKNNFKIEKFFITASNVTLSADLYIYGDLIDYAITYPSSINSTEVFNINISNNSSDGKLIIYSANLNAGKSQFYSINPSFTKEIDYGQSVDLMISSSSNAGIGQHQFNLDLETNIGSITKSISLMVNPVEEIDVLTTFVELPTSDSFDFNTTNSEAEKVFKYNSFVQGNVQQSIEKVSLEYSSGNVGTYCLVTGVEITNAGSGYVGDAVVTFSEGTGNDSQAIGEVIMDGDSVDSVSMSCSSCKNGIYFNTPPTVTFSGTFSGGAGDQNAEGVVLYETRQKTFTDIWDVCSGLYSNDLGFSCFKENGLTGNQGDVPYDYATLGPGIYENSSPYNIDSEQDFFVKVVGKSVCDFDNMGAKLKIKSSLADTQTGRSIEEFSISAGNIIGATPECVVTTTPTPTTTTTTTSPPTTTTLPPTTTTTTLSPPEETTTTQGPSVRGGDS